MTEQAKKVKFLKDYQSPEFKVNHLKLTFELEATDTVVHACLSIEKLASVNSLKLNGENLELLAIKLDDKALDASEYQIDDEFLTIHQVPQQFELTTKVKISPAENTALTGLYLSQNNFCTQCEAEGFRRITYFFDRPDYLTLFTVKIIADKTKFPVLLSNGNPIDTGELPDNRHFVVWEDPFYKPCYLFALVAGKLEKIEDEFKTMNHRTIKLQIYVEKGNESKATYAMSALKDAMRWDEVNYGREYDLDIFMIVAVSDFNMGAMENKGLNIFNSKYILASKDTATDDDYEFVAAVIAHEYFHNWSGNRVTCRDWFQLSLKEGFTVFRDQSYTADTTSKAVKRIRDAKVLRMFQFAEDAGPMAHPVQPDSYIEIDNFYTHTVYEKGAEVIRMMQTIIGKEAFVKGAKLYFAKHDGQAVTILDFVAAMEAASDIDLTQFKLWYKQAGTPKITISLSYDVNQKTLLIKTGQSIPNVDKLKDKKPMHIPLAISLYNDSGEKLESKVLELKNSKDEFTIENIDSKPIISLLNDFSAPVEIDYSYSQDELAFLMAHDQNAFSRFEAGQKFIKSLFCDLAQEELPTQYLQALKSNLLNNAEDQSFISELLALPSEKYLLNFCLPIQIEEKHRLYNNYEKQIAVYLFNDLLKVYHENKEAYALSKQDRARRKLKNTCLYYLTKTQDKACFDLALQQYENASNMTCAMGAFRVLVSFDNPYREKTIQKFYDKYFEDNLVLDKWFATQAMADLPHTLDNIKTLMQNKAFSIKNPNKVRALIGSFSLYNLGQFHRADGKGYEFLADIILQLNQLNPQVAARLLEPLIHWKNFANPNQFLMKQNLSNIRQSKDLSPDVYEIVEKALSD